GVRRSEPVRQLNRAWLARNAEAFALIHQGAKLSRGLYPMEFTGNPYTIELAHLSSLRGAVRLCMRAAVVHAEEGDAEAAADDLFAARRLAASLGDCMVLVVALVRIAADAIVVEGLERTLALCEMPADRLALLREEITGEEQELSLTRALVSEKAGAHYLATGPAEEIRRLLAHSGVPPGAPLDPQVRARNALHLWEAMDRAIRVSQMPDRAELEEAARLEEEMTEVTPELWLFAMWMPAIGRLICEEVKGKARVQVARSALAVEQWRLLHGSWPDSLEQLVPELVDAVPEDPFSDGKLRYERQEEGVVVYSVGPDGEDDAGVSLDEAHQWSD
ncbi:MAG: hypothetical protein KAX19_04815, partial [Candidatus Brocadiae bacterium]|nr:hypothetical protein [Candidatus Brocadiia bacterium]